MKQLSFIVVVLALAGGLPVSALAPAGVAHASAPAAAAAAPIKRASVMQGPPDFRLSATSSLIVLQRGETATVGLTLESILGFADVVNLTLSPLPEGISASIAPAQVQVPGNAVLSVTALPNAVPGPPVNVTVVGDATGLTHTLTLQVFIIGQRTWLPWISVGAG